MALNSHLILQLVESFLTNKDQILEVDVLTEIPL